MFYLQYQAHKLLSHRTRISYPVSEALEMELISHIFPDLRMHLTLPLYPQYTITA
jgi:hypothetical protein